jgi:alkylhydroperoxidase family enzyme
MAHWGRLLAEIKRPMDRRRFELATFAAALELRHSACALAHGRVMREFYADAQIVAIAEGRVEGVLPHAEQVMLRFARQVAKDASRVTAQDIAELRTEGYTDAEIFDIAAAAAGRAFFTKLLDAMGVLADAPFLDLECTLRDALTVGRPIDRAPCVTMTIDPPIAAEASHAR